MAHPIYEHNENRRRVPRWPILGLALVVLAAVGASYYQRAERPTLGAPLSSVAPSLPMGGKVLGVDAVRYYTASEAQATSRQNYGAVAPVITTGVMKVTFHYRSFDTDGTPIVVYGRAYIPNTGSSKLPVFAFAPGTTGIGDQCAASLEQPQVANFGNYDSHMVTYASQGYVAVTTDYEGMRDPSRLHHYMVGPLEGRALLDSVRALAQLSQTKDRADSGSVYLAGYSQGGHAAFWADTINRSYAPELKVKGVIGYGPVLSVEQTMNDVTRGSILEWFGPYVLASYADYYHHDYKVDQILTPRVAVNLVQDVTSHCVDSAYAFWGHDDTKNYLPEYLSAIQNGTLEQQYSTLTHDLQQNATGTESTPSAKLIAQGRNDVVVLPGQAQAALPTMCRNSQGPVALKLYQATHFNTMVVSLSDTLRWMKEVQSGTKPTSTCS